MFDGAALLLVACCYCSVSGGYYCSVRVSFKKYTWLTSLGWHAPFCLGQYPKKGVPFQDQVCLAKPHSFCLGHYPKKGIPVPNQVYLVEPHPCCLGQYPKKGIPVRNHVYLVDPPPFLLRGTHTQSPIYTHAATIQGFCADAHRSQMEGVVVPSLLDFGVVSLRSILIENAHTQPPIYTHPTTTQDFCADAHRSKIGGLTQELPTQGLHKRTANAVA